MKLLLLGLLLLLGNTGATAPPAPVRVAFAPLTKAAYAAATCINTKPRVTFPLKKAGGRLVIPTAKGQQVFQDRKVEKDNPAWTQYAYEGYLSATATHTIRAILYERTNYVLLEKNGRETLMYDKPVYAPDGRSFVSASQGLEYGVYPNVIRLFRYEGGCWREVWSLEPKTWEPQEICWTSSTTLVLSKEMWTGKNPGTTYTYARLTVQ